MFITDPKELQKYAAPYRLWQGIPGIEVTPKGRIYSTFYSGGIKEYIGNYVVLLRSDDGFTAPVAAAYWEDHRCFDPVVWIDPLGRLWLSWACAPDHGVYASICADPDADELEWSEVFRIGGEVMMNRPLVLSSGEWYFPLAVWDKKYGLGTGAEPSADPDRKAFVYKTVDRGETFEKLGGVDCPKRSFDEHMVLERRDGTLAMYIRTTYGIAVSYSHDRGKTWTSAVDSGLGGPCSRFFIRRLRSGRVLLVNHYAFNKRNNLTALLSEDDGRTWKYRLLLDERSNVSYPDGVEAGDGFLYITYDRERGAFRRSLEALYNDAREILVAKITEKDIMAGAIVTPGSRLKWVISKLGAYAREEENPYQEPQRYNEKELSALLAGKTVEEALELLFEWGGLHCAAERERLDPLIDRWIETGEGLSAILEELRRGEGDPSPVVDQLKSLIRIHLKEELSMAELAEMAGISRYYMCHLFKKETGITVTDYRNELRLTCAKELLVSTDRKIAEIAYDCGFGSESYFCKRFAEIEKITPGKYRQMLKVRENEK